MKPIIGEDLAELAKLNKQMGYMFASSFGELELEFPRLTRFFYYLYLVSLIYFRFHDMSEFLPLNGPTDTALLLGYDIESGNTAFIHLFEYGAYLEIRHCKWSQGWSHLVPFSVDGEAYCIL